MRSRHKFHRLVKPNVEDIAPLISKYISDNTADVNVREEALKCFQVPFSRLQHVRYTVLICLVLCLLLTPSIRWWWDHPWATSKTYKASFRRVSWQWRLIWNNHWDIFGCSCKLLEISPRGRFHPPKTDSQQSLGPGSISKAGERRFWFWFPPVRNVHDCFWWCYSTRSHSK